MSAVCSYAQYTATGPVVACRSSHGPGMRPARLQSGLTARRSGRGSCGTRLLRGLKQVLAPAASFAASSLLVARRGACPARASCGLGGATMANG